MTGRQKMIAGWTVLIAGAVVIFIAMEGYALMQPTPDDGITLSRYVWEISQAWPPIIFVVGWLCGLLTSHFWWRWNPEDGHDHRG